MYGISTHMWPIFKLNHCWKITSVPWILWDMMRNRNTIRASKNGPFLTLMVYHIFQDHSHKTTLNSQIPVAKSQQIRFG